MFDQTQSRILDGLLISDGYIPAGQHLFYFAQRSQNREYVDFVAEQLGIPRERVRDRARKPDKRTGKVYECSELRTLSHPFFAELRERWYRDGRKVVPGDISISREFLLHWFLCDGACSVNRSSAHMVFCTDSFTRPEVEYLIELLASAGIEGSLMRTNRIRIHQNSIERFYDYIGECPVVCLRYKWIPVENRACKQQNLKPFYEEIHNLYISGWSCSRIAQRFETKYASIRYVLKNHFGISFGKNPAIETTCREGVVAPSETIRRASASCG
jgi:hypothetical protein